MSQSNFDATSTTSSETLNSQTGSSSSNSSTAADPYNDGRTWEEITIPVPWGTVSGKWWGPRNQQPILALHGWQDNAGTFDRLLPLLPADLAVLCLDLPGHGYSTHYPPGMQYYLFWDGIALIRRIVNYFNWGKMTMLGHSLGGALCFMYAASFPEDVKRLMCIDIAGPTIRDALNTAKSTGMNVDRALKYETLPPEKMPCYGYEEMLALVVDAYAGSLNRQSAAILMRRGMTPIPERPGCYRFTRDVRLKVSGLAMFTIEQVLAYAVQVQAEVLNIRGVPGMRFDDETTYSRTVDAMRTGDAKRVVYLELEGTHHLHLDTPEPIAEAIMEFLGLY